MDAPQERIDAALQRVPAILRKHVSPLRDGILQRLVECDFAIVVASFARNVRAEDVDCLSKLKKFVHRLVVGVSEPVRYAGPKFTRIPGTRVFSSDGSEEYVAGDPLVGNSTGLDGHVNTTIKDLIVGDDASENAMDPSKNVFVLYLAYGALNLDLHKYARNAKGTSIFVGRGSKFSSDGWITTMNEEAWKSTVDGIVSFKEAFDNYEDGQRENPS